MSIQTTTHQYNGLMDPYTYQQQQQQQQQQQAYQLPPQVISDRLRMLTQRASQPQQPQQQTPYHQPIMTISQYQQLSDQQQQQQQQHPSSPENEFLDSNQNKAAKRAEHNAIERARREHLNIKFQQLAHSLPNLQNDRRPSKGTIIERTLEFVKQTVQKEERYKNEIRELSRANRQLMLQVANKPLHHDILEEDEEDVDYDIMDDLEDPHSHHRSILDGDDDDYLLLNNDTLSRKSSCSSIEAQSMTSAPTIGSTSSVSLTTSPSVDGYHPNTNTNPVIQHLHLQQQHQHQQWDDAYYQQQQQYMMMDPSLLKQHHHQFNTNPSLKFEPHFMS
ncbi:unnamed protein product [Cunninghamella echinulata]